jgi:hypothetical protein
MRSLRAGATFFYDERILLGYRRHDSNLSSRLLWMQECTHDVHRWYADFVDPELARETLAADLFKIGRSLVDEDRLDEARRAFRDSLRHELRPRALAWSAVLAMPRSLREPLGQSLVGLRRSLLARRPRGQASAP